MNFIENQIFSNDDFRDTALPVAEYSDCEFRSCNFESCNLSDFRFISCKFTSCNLSLVTLNNTSMSDLHFDECKILGVNFFQCNQFFLSFSFQACNMRQSAFAGLKLKKTVMRRCDLSHADFEQADLTNSVLESCNLTNVNFYRTNLEKADFRKSHGFIIDPEANRVRRAKFDLISLPGLLNKYGIEVSIQ